MMFGLDAKQTSQLCELVVDPLKKMGAEVYIFGSRTTDKHHPFSDVDLVYRMNGIDRLTANAGLVAGLKEAIEESNFPFTVEIVSWDDLAESYRENVRGQMQKL